MRTPVSTYRIQITEDFDLHEAARVLPYLHDLGVDWVYLSPLLAAEAHSNHGYDVVRPRPHRRRPGAGCRAGGGVGRGAPPRDGRAGRHRAQPHRRRHAGDNAVVVGRADARAGLASYADGLRHRLGGRRRPGAHPGRRRRRPDATTARSRTSRVEAGRAALPRPRASRSRPARRRARGGRRRARPHRAGRARPPALRAGVRGAMADDGLNYRRFFAVNTPRRDARRGPRGFAETHARSGGGSARASSTACGSTTPTACATPSATSTTSPS